ncbi:phage terminase small subunit P27 family [Xenorhabdus bovienii]|uniref:Phage terminase small subunit P27 family n=1 Tax=Xenorhabdus aichiensis TaxID=3025874 RepID=A0ABT5M7T1_9GAMM|nr:phage terminase small subunit P27 family [Xenorhabdus bovienii]MCG3463114.1 phage terminase small subunit P27 family [Xenorhabdus bovienii]MDC9623761.1 phage terminase small subunit P27 family [Xenorhabdus aichiensis]
MRGNPSKRPINKNEPKPPTGVPPTPKYFDKQGKYWFKRMAEELDALGVMSQLDAKALELLVEAYVEYRHHCDTLEQAGYTYPTTSATGDKIIKAHPAAVMKADAWKRLRAMLGEFGMTPSTRAKVNMNSPDQADPLEDFLKARD